MLKTSLGLGCCVVTVALVALGCGSDRPAAGAGTAPEMETIVQGTSFDHVFSVPNTGRDSLVVKRVVASPGAVVRVDSVIPPDSTGRVAVRVPVGNVLGVMNAAIRVEFAGKHPPARYRVLRRVVAPVEIAPQNDFYFFTAHGEPAHRTLSIVNHVERPLQVRAVTSSNPLFHAVLGPVEAGRRYQVDISLDSAAPVGRHTGTIRIATDNPQFATLAVEGYAVVKPVVSASLDELDYERVNHDFLDRDAAAQRTVLVRKYRGTDFRVLQAATDVPFLTVRVEPATTGESYLVHVRIEQDRAPRGRFAGALRIQTNDASARELTLPIHGEIL